jgi:hypothetical protein
VKRNLVFWAIGFGCGYGLAILGAWLGAPVT